MCYWKAQSFRYFDTSVSNFHFNLSFTSNVRIDCLTKISLEVLHLVRNTAPYIVLPSIHVLTLFIFHINCLCEIVRDSCTHIKQMSRAVQKSYAFSFSLNNAISVCLYWKFKSWKNSGRRQVYKPSCELFFFHTTRSIFPSKKGKYKHSFLH